MSHAVVQSVDLSKRYGSVVAVDKLNLTVYEGEIFGFLGPNGSGKTTTILMMLGLTEPSAGEVRVMGYNPVRQPIEVKRVVSYLPETVGFYHDMTAAENLDFTAALNGLSKRAARARINEVLDTVKLAQAGGRPVGAYSRGMKQRLGIADALIKNPRIVFLDDPTIGLDPEGIEELLKLIESMGRDLGITVFLSSHLLQHVQRICDRVGIMFRGRMQAQGAVTELLAEAGRGELRIEVLAQGDLDPVVRRVQHMPDVQDVRAHSTGFTVEATRDVRSHVARLLVAEGAELLEMRAIEQSLEDLYMHYFRESEAAEEVAL